MNDSRHRDPRHEVCDELAELLATEEGARTARLLQMAGLLGPVARTEEEIDGEGPAEVGDRPAPISIWQPVKRDGERVFVRPEPRPTGDHYAQRRTIPARKADGRRRLAFFGESAAAGYLYAPLLTPAGVLEERLNDAAAEPWEVVDLARTNETLGSLAATVRAAMQLDPDVLAIFAGNNWNLLETPEVSPYFPSVAARQRYGLALRRGIRGPLELAARRLQERAKGALAAIAEAAGEIPVVLVIPEVNFTDWEDRQPPPWLDGDGTRRWYELYDRARELLVAGRYPAAVEATRSLLDLDGGHCPTGHLLLARAFTALGELGDTRKAFESHVEQGYASLAFLGAPRATPVVKWLLRRAADRHGFAAVDLPEVFARPTGSPLPGRRLFLDYCHLTREGIEVAMAAVAQEVLRLRDDRTGRSRTGRTGRTGRTCPTGAEAEPLDPEPSDRDAVAYLGAAVHTAHRMAAVSPKGPVIERLLRQALAASPGVAGALRDLAAARAAPCPEVLTAAQERNLASPYRLLLQHGWRWDHLDPELLLAICRVLGEAAAAEIRRRLLEHHAVEDQPRDLARPPYLWEPVERFYPQAMGRDRRAFYRAPWRSSRFCLIAGGRREVTVEPTVRLPAVPGGGERRGEVAVWVNGEAVAAVEAGESWSRSTVKIPRRVLRPAINRLTLRWPIPTGAGEAARSEAVRRLEHGLEADVHPVFGEVFSLLAAALDADQAVGARGHPGRHRAGADGG